MGFLAIRTRLTGEWIWLDLVRLEVRYDSLSIEVRSCDPAKRPLAARLLWPRFCVYGVRNEDYVAIEPRSDGERGPFRELTDTDFLRYARSATWQEQAALRHWQISCSDQVVDIASDCDPDFEEGGLESAPSGIPA